jgi:hypothetical protein
MSINTTITFREDVKGWVSFKSFVPEFAISMANNYYTFNNGKLWLHHDESVDRNTFYNVHKNSSFKAVLNSFPDTVKSFNTISYEGTQSKVTKFIEYTDSNGDIHTDKDYYNLNDKTGWWVTNIQTDLQNASIPEFIDKENKWFNYLKGINIETNIDGVVTGFLDPGEFSFQGLGWVDDINVWVGIFGCTNSDFIEYNPNANIDDGSCSAEVVEGCTNPSAANYDSNANTDDGTCSILGCTDPTAFNYNSNANTEDGSCIPTVYGCLDSNAINYASTANTPCDIYTPDCDPPNCTGPGSYPGNCCTGAINGCMDSTSSNYDPTATVDDGSCIYAGCRETSAFNYDSNATADCDGNPMLNATWCCCFVGGCMDTNSVNYDSSACHDDGSCIPCVYGCTDTSATNYDPSATCDDGSCTGIWGCTDTTANNYNSAATDDDGNCQYCQSPLNYGNNNPSGWHLSNATETSFDVIMNYQNSTYPYNALLVDVTIYYKPLGGTWTVVGTGFTPLTPPYTITGLTGNTTYEVNVIGNCSNTTFPSGVNQITTLPSSADYGCTDPVACNYDSSVSIDNGSCTYVHCAGCMDPAADNYNYGDGSYHNATGPCVNVNGTPIPCTIGCEYGNESNDCCTYTVPGCLSNDMGPNADLFGDANPSSGWTVGGPGSFPCTGVNQTDPYTGQVGWNQNVHADSTVSDCKDLSGTPIGYLATNANPEATTACVGAWVGTSTNAEPGGCTDGNLSTGIQNFLNNGCTYNSGCTDDGNYAVNTYDYTPYVPSQFLEANGGHYPDGTSGGIGGSLTPGIPAYNWNPLAGIDDGSCVPVLYGCRDEVDDFGDYNKNVGRACQSVGTNEWPTPVFMDIPVVGYETRRDSSGSHPIDNNALIPFEDVNTHNQACCILDNAGCVGTGANIVNTNPNIGAANPDDGWTIKKGTHGTVMGPYGNLGPSYFMNSSNPLFLTENRNTIGNSGCNSVIDSWDVDDCELYQQLLPNGQPTNWGGTPFGAYNHTEREGTGATSNIAQEWSPVNMEACCFIAGCLHPRAYNFDLKHYRYETIVYPQGQSASNWYYAPQMPSATNPTYDPSPENLNESCAFCDGTPADQAFRIDANGCAGGIGDGCDPDTWDGTQGYNGQWNVPEYQNTIPEYWTGYTTYNQYGGDAAHYAIMNSYFPKEFDCCCFDTGCTDPAADNYNSYAQCGTVHGGSASDCVYSGNDDDDNGGDTPD